MTKFATKQARPNVTAPVTTTGSLPTYEGGAGHERDAKSELFLLAVSNLVSERTFYEDAASRDGRFETLIHQITATDPDWMRRFIPWLRDAAQMRSASVVAAAEYVKAGGPNGRQVVAETLKRADEPAEVLAYWAQRHGRRFPMPIKRGVADACVRLYNERSALKYDGQGKAWRMGDVIDLTHPRPTAPWQSDLFRWLIDRRHNRAEAPPESLTTVQADARLLAMPEAERRAALGQIGEAGWTWERLSGWLPGGMDAQAWEAVIPNMGYMALLRNLRNFDQAGIGAEAVGHVQRVLTDPEQVARSRQFPIRFFSAYKHVQSERWKPALETAVNLAMGNVPVLPGKTLVMVDVSGSMTSGFWSNNSTVEPWETAGLFGVALALRAEHADLVVYSNDAARLTVERGASPFWLLGQIRQWGGFGGGTNTIQTLAAAYSGHDRVIVLTDEQAFGASGFDHSAVRSIPLIYTFNLAGYKAGHLPSGGRGRYTFGGLTDQGFTILSILENMRDAEWPF